MASTLGQLQRKIAYMEDHEINQLKAYVAEVARILGENVPIVTGGTRARIDPAQIELYVRYVDVVNRLYEDIDAADETYRKVTERASYIANQAQMIIRAAREEMERRGEV